jgi:hypothetical protein
MAGVPTGYKKPGRSAGQVWMRQGRECSLPIPEIETNIYSRDGVILGHHF